MTDRTYEEGWAAAIEAAAGVCRRLGDLWAQSPSSARANAAGEISADIRALRPPAPPDIEDATGFKQQASDMTIDQWRAARAALLRNR